MENIKEQLKEVYNAGLMAVKTDNAVKNNVQKQGNVLVVNQQTYNLDYYKKIYVVGAGKGVAPMAKALEEILGDHLYGGMVIVKYGHGLDLETIKVVEAEHPTPDQAGLEASKQLVDLMDETTEEDLVICLITGGASSLLTLPLEGITLEDKQKTTRVLLECGATIHEINTIRKHLSAIKAGRLAEIAYPAHIITLIVSDVIGSQHTNIGSGPTAPDHTTFKDCKKIITKYHIEDNLPENVIKLIEGGIEGRIAETPKEEDQIFDNVNNMIIADNLLSVSAAKEKAKELGYNAVVFSSTLQGEAREVARALASIAIEVRNNGNPIETPACILIGGETTVHIHGNGKGGRNQELALSMAIELKDADDIYVLCAGSDGTDGPTDAAGALIDNTTYEKAMKAGMDPWEYLDNNDSYNFFKPLDQLLVTGPTLTNVMDINVIIIP